MDNQLLDGFFLQEYLIEPLVGRVSGSGKPAHLPSRSVEVLLCLAKQPRRLVTREEILSKVWGDGHGSSENLSHAMYLKASEWDQKHHDKGSLDLPAVTSKE